MASNQDLVGEFRAAVHAWIAADADASVPVRVKNKLFTARTRAAAAVAESIEGRESLTHVAEKDPDPNMRLAAAVTVQDWDQAKARAVFEDLVRLSGGEVVRPMTMTSALAAPWGIGRTAALCIYNFDMPPRRVPPPVHNDPGSLPAPVPAHQLDAAERVYGLAMRGGLEHAYELAGDQFLAASEGLEAVGATESASVLREFVALAERNAEQEQLDRLDARFAEPDEIMARLKAAASEAD